MFGVQIKRERDYSFRRITELYLQLAGTAAWQDLSILFALHLPPRRR
jgi:hypothetical protein